MFNCSVLVRATSNTKNEECPGSQRPSAHGGASAQWKSAGSPAISSSCPLRFPPPTYFSPSTLVRTAAFFEQCVRSCPHTTQRSVNRGVRSRNNTSIHDAPGSSRPARVPAVREEAAKGVCVSNDSSSPHVRGWRLTRTRSSGPLAATSAHSHHLTCERRCRLRPEVR